jgi:hypothetical protein
LGFKNDLVALAMELGLDDNDAKDLAQGLGDTKPSSHASSSKPLSISKVKGKHSEASKNAVPTKPMKSGTEVAEVAKKAEGTPAS